MKTAGRDVIGRNLPVGQENKGQAAEICRLEGTVHQEPEVLWLALVATGADVPEAAVQLWAAGTEACREMAVSRLAVWFCELARHSFKGSLGSHLGDPLEKLLEEHPELANQSFGKCENLIVEGDLALDWERGARTMPHGLQVNGMLFLNGWPTLQGLPGPVHVDGLWLKNCPGWDGVLPDGIHVRVKIFTGAFPFVNARGDSLGQLYGDPEASGITLQEWRKRYGFGSCHPEQPKAQKIPQERLLAVIERLGGYVSGDCGVFAIALAESLAERVGPGRVGLVIADGGEGSFISHVAVEYDGCIYDAGGVRDEEDMHGYADYPDEEAETHRVLIEDADLDEIQELTNPQGTVEEYRDAIRAAFDAETGG